MKPTATKALLLLVPGDLKMTAAIMTSKEAAAVAERRGYIAWWWEKRAKRLYGMVKHDNA